ncbi:hypothetical protein NJL88_02295 [Streptomyces sp. DK15]|uniref:hypothetical protein n=1 Tax=Streptomyces sp. DK15 TaxID=2957499 RepID=UPI0029AF9277|nr:hypothetical protein [Streptomyces sp. DK15]MDX2388935.1 hypothetical protein [Streptomyces sp. DK15]
MSMYTGGGHLGPPEGRGGGPPPWPGYTPAPAVAAVPPQGYPYPSAPPPGYPYAGGPHPGYPYPGGPYPGYPYAPVPPSPVVLTRRQKVVRFVFNPLYAAQRVFRPSRPGLVSDPLVRKLQLWRTLLGAAAWLALTYTYTAISSAEDVGAVASDRFGQSWDSVLVLACTFPVVVGSFAAAARGPVRRLYLRRALRSLGAVLALMAAMGSFALVAAPGSQGLRDAVGLPGKIAMGLMFLWALGFALYGTGLSLVHVFRTADIHELVPPVLATLLVWEMAVLDLINGTYDQVPPVARLVFVLGAPVTVTALSVWEAYRLRRHHGLSLRRALRP